VLIVNGDEDQVTPLSGARQLNDRLARSRIEVLPRCGHWPMQERTGECSKLLAEFLLRQR
jgi:3-oxoadipate enol-lactonase